MRKSSSRFLDPLAPGSDRSWRRQGANSQIASWQLQFIQQNYGPPSQFIYATAVAPYVGLPSGDQRRGPDDQPDSSPI